MLEAQLWIHAKDLIRHGQSIVFEKGLWLQSERDDKRREARELGVDIELHYFDVPLDELVRRLEKRNSQGNPNTFRISRAEIKEYFKADRDTSALWQTAASSVTVTAIWPL